MCNGSCQLRHYIRLEVTFHTHEDDYVYETTDLPDELILKADGANLFKETANRIGPIENYYLDEINEHSASLVASHSANWPEKHIWKQKQTLDSVPVYEICYDLSNGNDGRFWVFGENKLIFSDDYPAQCCCCCNVPSCCKNCAWCNDSRCDCTIM